MSTIIFDQTQERTIFFILKQITQEIKAKFKLYTFYFKQWNVKEYDF